jgi:asparagine synthase (glutamine-hydrolysing)
MAPFGDGYAMLNDDVRSTLDLAGYRHAQYESAIAEVDHLESESYLDYRMRISSYLHLTRFLRLLLDRKDRMSMAVGLEVRVPFCDHRLVEYVYNAPWSLKTYDGREKSLLRGAARDLLPASVAQRVKSPYPSTQDPHYVGAIQEQVKDLLGHRDHDVFSLVNPNRVSDAVRQEPAAISPTARHGLEQTLDLAAWLDIYRPRITMSAGAASAAAHPPQAA